MIRAGQQLGWVVAWQYYSDSYLCLNSFALSRRVLKGGDGFEEARMRGYWGAWMLGCSDGRMVGCAPFERHDKGAQKGHPAHPWTRASQNMTWHEPFRLFFLFPFYSCPSAGQTNFSTVFRCDPWVKYYVTRWTQRKRWQPSRYD